MLISIHIPKTAGTSFGHLLKTSIGLRVLMDYGDWVGWETPESIERRSFRALEMREQRDSLMSKYDTIHGHFIADKYVNLFPHADFVAFVRDPYQQAISNYNYILRNPQIDHPAVRYFHQENLSIIDFISWDMRWNIQSLFIGKLPIDDFAMIGITEKFTQSLKLINKMFRFKLVDQVVANANPVRQGDFYEISQDVLKAVNKYCDKDVELYRVSNEKFTQMLTKWGV